MKKSSNFLFSVLLLLHSGAASSVPMSLTNESKTTSQNSEVQVPDQNALQVKKLNAKVADVIAAMEETSFPEEQPIHEHVKKGRIIPRKGVDINATFASTTAATITISTSNLTTELSNATEVKLKNVILTPMVNASDGNSKNSSNNVLVSNNNVTIINQTSASDHTPSLDKNVIPAAISNSSKPTVLPTTPSTTSTSTTTTRIPNKPKITYSVDDEPRLLQAAKPGYNTAASFVSSGVANPNGRLHIEEPLAELSKEYIPQAAMMEPSTGHREYVVPVVTLIFAIPLLIGLFLLSYRRAKEFWLTRHYRRMDFLVDGMYNY